ncbi:hypothetical protein MYX78_10890 [Acidobacteria bacterium AH-259-G07]|nr:hypothetical protein [Acidobacteria bacterium AH-259-G07]
MTVLTGSFHSSGSPSIKISVYGAFPQAKQEFEAIIDTGFTGFLSMPLVKAFPLAIVLFGTTSVLLADGTVSHKLTGWGFVEIGDQAEDGIIILAPSSIDILVGIEFLKAFKKTLFLHSGVVALIDEKTPPAKKSKTKKKKSKEKRAARKNK